MTVDPATRRANRWLFIALVIFAIGFCAAILLWMRYRTVKVGGKVYPPAAMWSPDGTQGQPSPAALVGTAVPFSFAIL